MSPPSAMPRALPMARAGASIVASTTGPLMVPLTVALALARPDTRAGTRDSGRASQPRLERRYRGFEVGDLRAQGAADSLSIGQPQATVDPRAGGADRRQVSVNSASIAFHAKPPAQWQGRARRARPGGRQEHLALSRGRRVLQPGPPRFHPRIDARGHRLRQLERAHQRFHVDRAGAEAHARWVVVCQRNDALASDAPPGRSQLQSVGRHLTTRPAVDHVRVERGSSQRAKRQVAPIDPRVQFRCGCRTTHARLDGHVAAGRLTDRGGHSGACHVDCAAQADVQLRVREARHGSPHLGVRSLGVNGRMHHAKVVVAQVHVRRQTVEPGPAAARLHHAVARDERDGMAVRQSVALHRHRAHRKSGVDLLRAVFVPNGRVPDRKVGNQVIERLTGGVGVVGWTRDVVGPVGMDHVVHLDAFQHPRLDDVAASDETEETDVRVEPRDDGKRRVLAGPVRGDRDVAQMQGEVEEVEPQLIGAELDLLRRQELGDARQHEAPTGWRVETDQHNGCRGAKNPHQDAEPLECSPRRRGSRARGWLGRHVDMPELQNQDRPSSARRRNSMRRKLSRLSSPRRQACMVCRVTTLRHDSVMALSARRPDADATSPPDKLASGKPTMRPA